jgi:hypothetical protein
VGFEPAIPTIKRQETKVFHRAATGIGIDVYWVILIRKTIIKLRRYGAELNLTHST